MSILRAGLAQAVNVSLLLADFGIRRGAEALPKPGDATIARWIAGLLLFIFCAGFAFATVDRYLGVRERHLEFGVLRVLGASDSYFLALLSQETVLVAVPGMVAGIALSYMIASLFSIFVPGAIIFSISLEGVLVAGFAGTAAPLIGGIVSMPGAIREGVDQVL